jgi:Iap family predicted aminopeptidase
MKQKIFFAAIAFFSSYCYPQTKLTLNCFDFNAFKIIIGESFANNESYSFLKDICDYTGGRISGSEQNKKALSLLKNKLNALNITNYSQTFTFKTFLRGEDYVYIVSPIERKLRAITLGYNDLTNEIETEAVYANLAREEDFQKVNPKNKAVIVNQEFGYSIDKLTRYEQIAIAHKFGAVAIFFINDKPGFQVLAGVSNFNQEKSLIPSFSLTYEEGNWLKRLCENKEKVKLKFKVNSKIISTQSENIIAQIPGRSKLKIVIGAHFDSWDLGQGAIDNGLGSAILYDVCRIIAKHSTSNYYTLEFVWFNAEELGIIGAQKYAECYADSVALMINLDMPGIPYGINIMGFDHLEIYAKEFVKIANGFNFNETIANTPWTNSDHFPFIERGIPAITFLTKLEDIAVKHYHDYGDTFDKANKFQMSVAVAAIASFAYYIANTTLTYKKLNKGEILEMLKKYKLDIMLKKQNQWKF